MIDVVTKVLIKLVSLTRKTRKDRTPLSYWKTGNGSRNVVS